MKVSNLFKKKNKRPPKSLKKTNEYLYRSMINKEYLSSNPNIKDFGIHGENMCYNELNRIASKYNIRLLKNVFLISDDRKKIVECDIIGISDKAIYFFEVKNYGGEIVISDSDWWEVNDRLRPNSCRQNQTHIDFFNVITKGKYQKAGIPIKSVVVFMDRAHLIRRENCQNENTIICNLDEITKKIKDIEKSISVNQNTDTMNKLAEDLLKKYVLGVSDEEKKKHLTYVLKKENEF